MPTYYIDSSAAIKLYQVENGSETVVQILDNPASRCLISRLTIVEIERAFSRRRRGNEVSQEELEELRLGLHLDLRRRRLRVKEVLPIHYRSAIRLVRKYSAAQPAPLVRTLDALHLTVAIDIRAREGLDFFVCADKDLCGVAEAEQLRVLNPTG